MAKMMKCKYGCGEEFEKTKEGQAALMRHCQYYCPNSPTAQEKKKKKEIRDETEPGTSESETEPGTSESETEPRTSESEKKLTEEERLDEEQVLSKIIAEASMTRKRPAIVRMVRYVIGKKNESIETLAEALRISDIAPSQRNLILRNWARHLDVEDVDHILKKEKSKESEIEKEEEKKTPVEKLKEGVKRLYDDELERLEVLKIRKQIADMERDISGERKEGDEKQTMIIDGVSIKVSPQEMLTWKRWQSEQADKKNKAEVEGEGRQSMIIDGVSIKMSPQEMLAWKQWQSDQENKKAEREQKREEQKQHDLERREEREQHDLERREEREQRELERREEREQREQHELERREEQKKQDLERREEQKKQDLDRESKKESDFIEWPVKDKVIKVKPETIPLLVMQQTQNKDGESESLKLLREEMRGQRDLFQQFREDTLKKEIDELKVYASRDPLDRLFEQKDKLEKLGLVGTGKIDARDQMLQMDSKKLDTLLGIVTNKSQSTETKVNTLMATLGPLAQDYVREAILNMKQQRGEIAPEATRTESELDKTLESLEEVDKKLSVTDQDKSSTPIEPAKVVSIGKTEKKPTETNNIGG